MKTPTVEDTKRRIRSVLEHVEARRCREGGSYCRYVYREGDAL